MHGGSCNIISVANTNASPVSCANVNILISTNGGATYTVLLANTPNDGSQAITVPNTPSTTCRIMVICSNGYFFDSFIFYSFDFRYDKFKCIYRVNIWSNYFINLLWKYSFL
jgi:hypothetical protein